MQFIADWKECMSRIERALSSDEPCFLSRIGGSDTNAVAALLEAREAGRSDFDPSVMAHLPVVQRYNGYYDLSGRPERYIAYLDTLLDIYKSSADLFFCNFQLLSMYLRDTIHPQFYRDDIEGRRGFELLIEHIARASPTCTCYPYGFIEKMVSHPYSMFNVFSTVFPGKKVLVVSPFDESIRANFGNRQVFFKNYDYPNFEVTVCPTPITYSGLPEDLYPHRDWFETTDALIQAVSDQTFDVALLSCGSYALPIGRHIAEKQGKKAIYVGGVLQLYFGVMGRRYSGNSFFEDQINSNSFIRPLEASRYLSHVAITPEMAREAFGAYF